MSDGLAPWFRRLSFPARIAAFAAVIAPGMALIAVATVTDDPTRMIAGFAGLLWLVGLHAFVLPASAFRSRR